MARQFLTGLNLNKNELLNARIQNLANDPSSPVLGQIYFNTSANELRIYNGTEFEPVGLNGVTASAAEINILDGATLSTAELNTLDGITASTAELNILDGATVTASELNILDGATITTTELNYLDGVSANIQTQLSELAPISNPVFTGDVTVVSNIVFEGSTANGNETTLTATDPTADRTITLPDASGTVILSTNTVNSLTAPAAEFSMNSQKITNLATPTDATDAATKAYVDAVAEGLHVHESARVTTDANVSLANGLENGDTLSGVTLVTGDRVLVKNQSTQAENGIYVVQASGQAIRALDFNTAAEVDSGDFIFVTSGTYANTGWVQTSRPATIGTDAITFVQFSGAGTFTAGDGLTLDGSEFNVVGTTDRITVAADSVDIASTYVGQSSITTLGTITTGVWNGTDIAVADGGTGASTAAGAKTNLGFMTRFAANNESLTPSSGVVTWAVTHNLGTKDITVAIYDLATNAEVEVDVVRTSTSVVTLSWVAGATVSADSYRVVVIG